MTTTHTGSCLCGGVTFRIDGELEPIQVCHCGQCRKAQGGPFARNIAVDVSAMHWLTGADLLKAYESSPGKERVFCGRCGSPLISRRESLPGIVRVRAGLIDEPLRARPAWHAHTASKCGWWEIADDLPRYASARVA
ncbi:MAG TPA: GFA family protein [Ramlibacter sp.]|uniref:GFA family protein n=1 Tax=Ramlibacter sp. TaxID=1917967 RepID=UPI002C774BE8|nr:GFA family protein [Ramlibacter sp.]HVZ42456.1 GFA family protein [Ramlibacter sp.]